MLTVDECLKILFRTLDAGFQYDNGNRKSCCQLSAV